MTTMTVTDALAELTLLEKRIDSALKAQTLTLKPQTFNF